MEDLVDLVPFFETHGWVVLRGAADADLVQALVRESDAIMPPERMQPVAEGVPQVLRPSWHMPSVAAWMATARPFELAARCLGASGVRLLQDALAVKPPRSESRLEWHQDARYFGWLEPLAVCSLRLALGPCTLETGCLRVRDGSHHGGLVAAADFGAARVEAVHAADDYREIAVELEAGDVSIHSALTLHASFANTSTAPRRTLITHVAADHCRIVPERLPPEARAHFPADDEGVPDPRVFWPLPLRARRA